MGNDGGSIPTRRELVKEAARNPTTTEIKQAQQEQEEHYWTTDPLSNRPLQRPVVSDSSGRLYNKDAVLEFLLPADEDDAAAVQRKADADTVLRGAVKSLRDVVEVKFTIDEEDSSSSSDGKEKKKNGSGGNGGSKEAWICPVTRETLGPGTKAVYLVPCGHAFAGSVIKEAGADGTCLQCGEAYAPNDVIPIVPTAEEDIARLQLRIKALKEKGLAHSLKKAPGGKKRKKGAAENGEAAAETKAKKKEAAAAADGIKNSATASLTAKVLAEQEERNKRRKMENNENLNSLFSSKDPKKFGKNGDFMSRGFDIPAQAKR